MRRRSLRTSSANATPNKASLPTPANSSSKRAKATPTKSQFFPRTSKEKVDATATDALSESPSPTPSTVGDEASGYEDEDASVSEITSEEEEEEDYSDSEPPPKKKQKRTSGAKAMPHASSKPATTLKNGQSELWREGVQTGLGHGTQVIIKKPKPRPAGKTPYEDHTIHPNTMLFLSELAENNDRQWLKMHDPDYRTSWNDFTSFLECLQQRLVEVDETIPELPTKDIIFRIYRDIRFSNDPTPYKTHFSAAWSRTGRKGPYAAYYVQVKPGGSFVGGGLWHPEAGPVAKLRTNIDRHPERIKQVLTDAGLRKEYLGGAPVNDAKVVKAFTAQNAENALKTKPKGFDSDHKDIDLLRLKNFTLGRKLKDEEVNLDRISELLACLRPFVSGP